MTGLGPRSRRPSASWVGTWRRPWCFLVVLICSANEHLRSFPCPAPAPTFGIRLGPGFGCRPNRSAPTPELVFRCQPYVLSSRWGAFDRERSLLSLLDQALEAGLRGGDVMPGSSYPLPRLEQYCLVSTVGLHISPPHTVLGSEISFEETAGLQKQRGLPKRTTGLQQRG